MIDLVVVVAYLVGIVAFGLRAGGNQRTAGDYVHGGRDLPWGAVCFSIVATETSTLTVIGIPAVAYGGSLVFLQLACGFLLGRVVVSAVLLPRYVRGELVTAYELLGRRFGDRMRALTAAVFLVTRLLADGVRLFATAIPVRVFLLAAGFDVPYAAIIVAVGLVILLYTYVGGLRAVVWVDAVQMGIYLVATLVALALLLSDLPSGWMTRAATEGKFELFRLGEGPLGAWLTDPYTALVAVLGGAAFSMASHGADQLVVQRVLATRSLADARKAMIGSGVAALVQFALFLGLGLLLWAHYDGATLAALGLTRGDEIFPHYVLTEMPPGLRGLLLAGILAAALSSSLSALAGSTVLDIVERLRKRPLGDADTLRWSRALTLFWGVAMIAVALPFEHAQGTVVELGLGIAGFTYGGLLGAFGLALASRRATENDAVIAMAITLAGMTLLINGVWWNDAVGEAIWFWRPGADLRTAQRLAPLAWPLYPLIGAAGMMVLGSLLGLRHRRGAGEHAVGEEV